MSEREKGYKRINFFKGFLTTERDWNEAERYHVEKRKLHNRMFHAPGVVPGYGGELRVTGRERADLSVEVAPGYAIDGEGQDIFLWETTIKTLSPADYKLPQSIYLILKYVEEYSDFIAYKENLEYKGHRRVHEKSKVEWSIVEPNVAGEVELCRIMLDEGVRKITEAKNPLAPQANEIDLRYLPWAGVSGSYLNPMFNWRLQGIVDQAKEVYSFLHREKKVTTSGDVFHAVLTFDMLLNMQMLDLRNIFSVLNEVIDLEWEFVNEVEAKIPVISAKKDFQQFKKNIEILKGLSAEKKQRTLPFLESILQYQDKAVEALKAIFAKEFQPVRKPAEVRPDEPDAKPADLGDDWEKIKVQSGQFQKEMVVDGVSWSQVDAIDILDRESEEGHEFAILEARDTYRTRQKLKYPDGKVVEDSGIAHEGGHSQWTVKNLTPGLDLAIIRRMDYVYGGYEADIFVDDKKAATVVCQGEDRKYRWRNWPVVIPGEFITGKEIKVRQVNRTADRDINMFHLWFYQAL